MADSKKIDDGGAAFPQLEVTSGERDGHGDLIEPFTSVAGGMSLRDWFAGKVLASVDWSDRDIASFSDDDLQKMAGQVYRISDAMIAARKAGA